MATDFSTMTSGVWEPAARVGHEVPAPRSVRLGEDRVAPVGPARLYVCGITPYDVTHLGHAATFVWADLLASVFEAVGAHASTCRNITDVDDVLMRAAQSRGQYYDELAVVQEFQFNRSMAALRVSTPQHEPHARHFIPAVHQLTQALLDRGLAYERDGWVRFRGAEVPSRAGVERDLALQLSGEYGDEPDDADKDDPFDVTLWRPSEAGDPAWPSPWGWGRPGWHAECAAMAMAVQGPAVDVLVGGEDLTFPHHAYQAAMVEAASGAAPFARARMHVGTVRLDGERMAKSTGNLVLVEDVLGRCSPAALRLLLLDRRYDEAWDFDQAGLDAATSRLERLYAAAAGSPGTAGERHEAASGPLLDRLCDDLDVPGALDLAEGEGGAVARKLVKILRLD